MYIKLKNTRVLRLFMRSQVDNDKNPIVTLNECDLVSDFSFRVDRVSKTVPVILKVNTNVLQTLLENL